MPPVTRLRNNENKRAGNRVEEDTDVEVLSDSELVGEVMLDLISLKCKKSS